MSTDAQKAAAKAREDRGFLFVDPSYLRDLEEFIKLGRFKMSNDRYKYSTSSIELPANFSIESLFEENATCNIKMSKERIKRAITAISNARAAQGMERATSQKPTKQIAVDGEEFSELYLKLLKKRREDALKFSEQTRLAKEIDVIKELKTKKFVETETLRLGGSLSREEREQLDKKIVQFKNGLSYANEKLNYRSAGKMLRNLRAIPQPPLKLSLGKRTRLYSFKTSANVVKAIDDLINDGVTIAQHPRLSSVKEEMENRIYKPGKGKDGEELQAEIRYKIWRSMATVNHIIRNGPIRSQEVRVSTHSEGSGSSQTLGQAPSVHQPVRRQRLAGIGGRTDPNTPLVPGLRYQH